MATKRIDEFQIWWRVFSQGSICDLVSYCVPEAGGRTWAIRIGPINRAGEWAETGLTLWCTGNEYLNKSLSWSPKMVGLSYLKQRISDIKPVGGWHANRVGVYPIFIKSLVKRFHSVHAQTLYFHFTFLMIALPMGWTWQQFEGRKKINSVCQAAPNWCKETRSLLLLILKLVVDLAVVWLNHCYCLVSSKARWFEKSIR